MNGWCDTKTLAFTIDHQTLLAVWTYALLTASSLNTRSVIQYHKSLEI